MAENEQQTEQTQEATQDGAAAPDVSAIVDAVRESIGLKDGERMDDKMRSMVTSSIRHDLGLEKDQTVKDMFADMLKATQPPPPPATDKEQKARDYEAITTKINTMQEKIDSAENRESTTKRNSHIRTSLGKFQVDDAVKELVIDAFISGHQADPVLTEDGNGLKVIVGDGQSVDFATFLGQYFEKNAGLLKTVNHVGTGARGSTSTGSNGGFKFDVTKHKEDGGRSLREEMARDPGGADKRIEEVGKALKKPVDDFFK